MVRSDGDVVCKVVVGLIVVVVGAMTVEVIGVVDSVDVTG